jgi:hypothetical protein
MVERAGGREVRDERAGGREVRDEREQAAAEQVGSNISEGGA